MKCCWEVCVQDQGLRLMGSAPRIFGKVSLAAEGDIQMAAPVGLLSGFGQLPGDESPDSGQEYISQAANSLQVR